MPNQKTFISLRKWGKALNPPVSPTRAYQLFATYAERQKWKYIHDTDVHSAIMVHAETPDPRPRGANGKPKPGRIRINPVKESDSPATAQLEPPQDRPMPAPDVLKAFLSIHPELKGKPNGNEPDSTQKD